MPAFWETKSLNQMTPQEWESVCDGCGKCCLGKIGDPAGGVELKHTNVACRLLDPDTCRCSSYEDRHRFVPDCVRLTPEKIEKLGWLPVSCAYRRLACGQGLANWHPLVSGDRESVHTSGNSIRGRMVSERDVKDFKDHIVDWLS
jgi:uncharacterized protein